MKPMGAAIRLAIAAYERTAFALGFADGGRMDLTQETRVMGILNVTPDSFSEGAMLKTPGTAVEAAARLVDDGADFVDVGGESTRPGAASVTEDEEVRRVVPVIQAIKRELSVRVSVDTMKSGVARLAIEAGADLVNDVSAFSDPAMLTVVRDARVPVIVMHMRGTPQTMQQDTDYVDLLSSVVGFLRKTVERAVASGIAEDKILVDPGLGFGKSAAGEPPDPPRTAHAAKRGTAHSDRGLPQVVHRDRARPPRERPSGGKLGDRGSCVVAGRARDSYA